MFSSWCPCTRLSKVGWFWVSSWKSDRISVWSDWLCAYWYVQADIIQTKIHCFSEWYVDWACVCACVCACVSVCVAGIIVGLFVTIDRIHDGPSNPLMYSHRVKDGQVFKTNPTQVLFFHAHSHTRTLTWALKNSSDTDTHTHTYTDTHTHTHIHI